MSSVPSRKHLAILHRLDDETAQRGNAFFDGGASDKLLGGFFGQMIFRLLPEPLVTPVLHLFILADLHVITGAGWRTHAAQCETTLMVVVDQLLIEE